MAAGKPAAIFFSGDTSEFAGLAADSAAGRITPSSSHRPAAMSSKPDNSSAPEEHDWHSEAYVDEWIARDLTRDEERRTILKRMLSHAPFAADAEPRVLDVGAGYGMVTEEVLEAFPRAWITFQDYSEEMLVRARRQLARHAERLTYVLCDLAEPSWTSKVGGPFDLVVSAIAIHNLRETAKIADCYRAIHDLLKPGGYFLDCDHFHRIGGIEANLEALRSAGFERAESPWRKEERTAILVAEKKR